MEMGIRETEDLNGLQEFHLGYINSRRVPSLNFSVSINGIRETPEITSGLYKCFVKNRGKLHKIRQVTASEQSISP